MSRTTIDFGIDLGTTNSAVACADRGEITVVKNNNNQETTPSVVRVDPRGAVVVGRAAYQQLELDPDNTAAEFKRLMGTQQTKTFRRSGRTWTPEELSAEVLKSLRQDVATWSGETVDAAVITVPALFELPQCEATQRAARLAGIDHAPLLQEPAAAALAYGMQAEAPSAYWMVYDLGGGTFDTSVVQVREGQIRVVEHGGDNFLGGRDLDGALVDYLVVRLKKEYALAGLSRESPASRRLFARLKALAEEARIQLSRLETWSVEVANAGEDEDGTPIETFVDLTRADYEALARPYVTKSIQIARAALQAAGLDRSAVERIVLVGGPTQTPLVRAMLEEAFRVPLETRLDPMTIVARGAAVFASMQRRPEAGTRPAPVAGAVHLKLAHTATTDDTSAVVGVRVEDASVPEPLTVELVRADGGWSSGRVPLVDRAAVVQVGLRPRTANDFAVRLQDGAGTVLPAAPDAFTIIQGLAEVTPILSRSLGVAVVDNDLAEAEVVLPKGTALPAARTKEFRTRYVVRAGSADDLKIHVVEGEHRRGSRNRLIGTITLRGADLARDLPPNAPVEVTMRIDASRAFQAELFLPTLDQTLTEVIEQKYSPLPAADELLRRLDDERERLRDLAPDDAALEASLDEVTRDVEAAADGDADAGERANRRLLDLAAALDAVEDADELPRLQRELLTAVETMQATVSQYGDAGDRRRFAAIADEGEAAVRTGDAVQLRDRIRALYRLRFEVLERQPGFWEALLYQLSDQVPYSTDPARAGAAVQTGKAAMQLGDTDRVRESVQELFRLLPESRRRAAERRLQDAGLRRR